MVTGAMLADPVLLNLLLNSLGSGGSGDSAPSAPAVWRRLGLVGLHSIA